MDRLNTLAVRSMRLRALLAVMLLVGGLIILVVDATAFEDPATGNLWEEPERWWSFNPLEKPGDSLFEVIPTLANVRTRYPLYVGMYAGLAARSIAGGRPENITYPTPLSALSVPDLKNAREVSLDSWYLEALSGYNAHQRIYRIRISQDVIDGWAEQDRLVEYPWNVWAVKGDSPEGRIVLHQDPRGDRLYVVPESLSPVFGASGSD